MMRPADSLVHIVGAGISGLGAAHFLKTYEMPSVIFEESGSIGGRAGYVQRGGRTFETGGKNFNSGWPLFTKLLEELNISDFDDQHPDFPILLGKRLGVISKKNKFKTALHLLRALGPLGLKQFLQFMSFVGNNRRRLNYSEGLIESIERKYDAFPVTHYFREPVANGPLRLFSIIMSAAEPDEMYYSSLVLNMAAQPGTSHSIKGGIKVFFEGLAKGHDVRLNTKIKKVLVENNRVVGLLISNGTEVRKIPASRVITTVPLHALGTLLDLPDDIKAEADKVRYYPVILIVAQYEDDIFDDRMMSLFFNNTYHLGHCSANRAYEKNVVRYTITGRRGRDLFAADDESLIATAEKELSTMIPISSKRIFYHVQRYERGICAYCGNYTSVKKRIINHVSKIDGLKIAGDYLQGHHLEGCLRSAKDAADSLMLSGAR